jgi:hypothetical protein
MEIKSVYAFYQSSSRELDTQPAAFEVSHLKVWTGSRNWLNEVS